MSVHWVSENKEVAARNSLDSPSWRFSNVTHPVNKWTTNISTDFWPSPIYPKTVKTDRIDFMHVAQVKLSRLLEQFVGAQKMTTNCPYLCTSICNCNKTDVMLRLAKKESAILQRDVYYWIGASKVRPNLKGRLRWLHYPSPVCLSGIGKTHDVEWIQMKFIGYR